MVKGDHTWPVLMGPIYAEHRIRDDERTTGGPMGPVESSELLTCNIANQVDLMGLRDVLPYPVPPIPEEEGAGEHTHRFAQCAALDGGTTDAYRKIIIERILGLARSAPRG